MTSYMISLRDVAPNDAHLGPAPRFLRLDDAGAATAMTDQAWLNAVLAQFPQKNGLPTGDLLLFVHGFNVGFASAVRDHLSYAAKLKAAGWTGHLVSYDWPSYGDPLKYYDDRSNARKSAEQLIDTAMTMFVRTLDPRCNLTVCVMAHSMGAFVVRRAFASAYQDKKVNAMAWQIAQLIFVAGDVAEASLSPSQDGKWLDKYCARTTSYSNRWDGVLQISDLKNGDPTPRAGRVGLPDDAPASFVGVDTSDFYANLNLGLSAAFNVATPHTYYFGQDQFWRDVTLTLGGGLDRNVFPTRQALAMRNRFDLDVGPPAPGVYEAALAHASV
jgi:esterase/lipase superfamily enzyme